MAIDRSSQTWPDTIEVSIETPMVTYHIGEQRNGRIKFSTDVDCIGSDVIRYSTQVFPDRHAALQQARMYALRGFEVCLDDEIGCEEIRPYMINGKIEGTITL